jgi:hypothetical protein
VGASAVAVSVVLLEQLPTLPQQLRILVEELGVEANVLIGGSATRSIEAASLPSGCHLVRDQLELDRRLDMLRH